MSKESVVELVNSQFPCSATAIFEINLPAGNEDGKNRLASV